VRRSASEKMEIIRLVEQTNLPVRATLRQLGVPRSTFYGWYQHYEAEGFDGLNDQKPVLRGWCNYFRHGVSKRTFAYVDHFAFGRVVGWLRKRHVGVNMHTLVLVVQGSTTPTRAPVLGPGLTLRESQIPDVSSEQLRDGT
jgi:hypothetical protein